MTPLDFEAAYAPLWAELEAVIRTAETRRKFDGARLATLYRRVCEHLALAQARAYPIHLTQRLEGLTQSAHRLIYRAKMSVRQAAEILESHGHLAPEVQSLLDFIRSQQEGKHGRARERWRKS